MMSSHDRVDAAFGRYDLSRRNDYSTFLLSHATVLPAIEEILEHAGIDLLLPDWDARRRRGALMSDLSALNLRAPAPFGIAPPEGPAALLGAAYVLEGSRLGSALLLRQARAGGDPAIQGATAYLSHGQGEGLWASFLDVLETSGPARQSPAQVAEGARATFMAFEAAALTAPRAEMYHVELAK